MHLTPEEFVDLAEGARQASTVPHLLVCARCRQQLADLRLMMTSIAEAPPVPEPSPLFWTHFGQRVSNAVSADQHTRGIGFSWLASLTRRPALVPLAAAAAIAAVIVTAYTARTMNTIHQKVDGSAAAMSSRELLSDSLDDDPSLKLVSDLTGDAADAAGLASRGSAEHAVTHLSNQDLRELRRLLRQEMGN